MPAEDPSPQKFVVAFWHAICAFTNWDYGVPEPLVTLERSSYSIQGICSFVMAIRGEAPDGAYDAVSKFAEQFRRGSEALGHDCSGPKDHTYEGVAACLYRLCDARRAYFERVDKR